MMDNLVMSRVINLLIKEITMTIHCIDLQKVR